MKLEGRHILLGVSGSIAAYKAAELVRLLKKEGADVQVLMTPDATQFITPLTLATLSGREVLIEIFPKATTSEWTQHIALGLWADLFVIAPATAQTIAKLAYGFSDSMLTATALAARCPLLVCPAMDHDMFIHPATQANIARLREYGYTVMEPGYGELASGLVGMGRLPEVGEIVERIHAMLPVQAGALQKKKVLVTAGPTREPIDPVRFLSNPSTGTMGYALAEEAARLGAEVVLVSGPTDLPVPEGVTRISVTTAEEMFRAVQEHQDADLVFMAAAVADYTPVTVAPEKLKKSDSELVLRLRRTPDILAWLGAHKKSGQQLIGFALETEHGVAHAKEKLRRKQLDWIVLNQANEPGAGFGRGTNKVTLIGQNGQMIEFPVLPKKVLARHLIQVVLAPEKARNKSTSEAAS